MVFGQLITKWLILCSALEVPLAQCSTVFKACCHLHNFVIDKQVDCHGKAIKVAYKNGGNILGYVPSDISTVPASASNLPQKLLQKNQSKSLSLSELNINQRKFKDKHRGMYNKSGQ
jgi:hypothetical protein